MKGAAAELAPQALQQAAEWFARLGDPASDAEEHGLWQAWLAAHPDHARAWQRVEQVTAGLAPLARTDGAARAVLERSRQHRRKTLRHLVVLLAAGGGALLASNSQRRPTDEHAASVPSSRYRAGPGELRAYRLADGSRIWLGSRSELEVAYAEQLRRLDLHHGDLLVETGADPVRPARRFVVATRHGRLRALGTRFTVRTDATSTRLEVFEGAVELTLRDASVPLRIVRAGEQLSFGATGVGAVRPARRDGDAWSRGLLIANGLRLDELAGELTRWHTTPVACDADVAALRVVGVYPLRELDRVLDALSASLPVEVRRDAAGVRLRIAAR